MKIKDILQRDPTSNPLVNQGQARISGSRDERTQLELWGELVTFVCEGQYADGVQRIIRSFLDNRGTTSQRGAAKDRSRPEGTAREGRRREAPGSAVFSGAASRTS